MQENILNQDNIISTIARVSLHTRKSEKTGNDYTIMILHFKNGLQIRYFVDPKDIFGIKDALKMKNKETLDWSDEAM